MIDVDQPSEYNPLPSVEGVADKNSMTHFQKILSEKHKEALNECDRLIEHFRNDAAKHRQNFRFLKNLSISLTLSVTALSILSVGKQLEEWEWAVPVISGLAALSTTLLSQTNSQKIWLHSRNLQQRLQVEKFLYLQDAGSYEHLEPSRKNRQFSIRVMEIWSESHENLEITISEQKKPIVTKLID